MHVVAVVAIAVPVAVAVAIAASYTTTDTKEKETHKTSDPKLQSTAKHAIINTAVYPP